MNQEIPEEVRDAEEARPEGVVGAGDGPSSGGNSGSSDSAAGGSSASSSEATSAGNNGRDGETPAVGGDDAAVVSPEAVTPEAVTPEATASETTATETETVETETAVAEGDSEAKKETVEKPAKPRKKPARKKKETTVVDSVEDGDFNPTGLDGKATKGIEPPKSNWALKLDTPPYRAYAVTCGITFTFGGLRTNNRGQVMDTEERVMPGLYAAGELVGGLFYNNYPGGSGLMAGSVFGKLAGASAAQDSLAR